MYELSEYTKAEEFHPQQVFSCDETGLFLKRMTNTKEDIYLVSRLISFPLLVGCNIVSVVEQIGI